VILLRELWYLPFTVTTFLSNRKLFKEADLVHINEITCLVPLILSKWMYKKKTVLHARAVMNADPKLLRTRMIGRMFRKYADTVIAIDERVKSSLPAHPDMHVVHNGLSLHNSKDLEDMDLVRRLNAIPKASLNLGFVGAMDSNKGIFDLLKAVHDCRKKGLDVKLFVLGGKLESARGFKDKIRKLFAVSRKNVSKDPVNEMVAEYGLQDAVHLMGFSVDISTFYRFIDVICFPSYYDAPGRPVFEGALFGKPSILAISKPCPDTFVDGVTGKQVEAGNIGSIASAIEYYCKNPTARKELGKAALQLAETNFDIRKNAAKVFGIYNQIKQR
jgi:glycosyltransferase involved in cell wall biosynthesis